MKPAYDYQDIIQELLEEIDDEILSEDFDSILILRGEEKDGYRPIIDWYYQFPEEDMEDWDDKAIEQYYKDKPNLEKVPLKKVLEEIIPINETYRMQVFLRKEAHEATWDVIDRLAALDEDEKVRQLLKTTPNYFRAMTGVTMLSGYAGFYFAEHYWASFQPVYEQYTKEIDEITDFLFSSSSLITPPTLKSQNPSDTKGRIVSTILFHILTGGNLTGHYDTEFRTSSLKAIEDTRISSTAQKAYERDFFDGAYYAKLIYTMLFYNNDLSPYQMLISANLIIPHEILAIAIKNLDGIKTQDLNTEFVRRTKKIKCLSDLYSHELDTHNESTTMDALFKTITVSSGISLDLEIPTEYKKNASAILDAWIEYCREEGIDLERNEDEDRAALLIYTLCSEIRKLRGKKSTKQSSTIQIKQVASDKEEALKKELDQAKKNVLSAREAIAKRDSRIKSLEEENKRLLERLKYVESLTTADDDAENEEIAREEAQETPAVPDKTHEDLLALSKGKKIIIIGGNTNLMRYLGNTQPNILYILDSDKSTFKDSLIAGADLVLFKTDCLSHSLYHKAKNSAESKGVPYDYISFTNMLLFEKDILSKAKKYLS